MVSAIRRFHCSGVNESFLFLLGNECLTQLSSCLQSHFAPFCPETIQYILRQFDFPDLPSNEHALSLVKLVLQVMKFHKTCTSIRTLFILLFKMAEDLQSSFPTSFLQQLLGPESPFLYLRSNNSAKVSRHGIIGGKTYVFCLIGRYLKC